MISLVNTGAILGWQLPPDVPLWAAALMLSRLSDRRLAIPGRTALVWRSGAGAGAGWFAFWNAVIWLIGLAFVVWFASDHIPEITEFMQRMPHLFREVMYAVRDFVRQ